MSLGDLIGFVKERAQRSAVLIYTKAASAEAIQEAVPRAEYVNVDTDASSLRNLDERLPVGTFRILLCSSEERMRGVDYRGNEKGLTLVIDCGFSTRRDALQGQCRVGRFGEKSERFITHDTQLIDEVKNKQLTKCLIDFQSNVTDVKKKTTGGVKLSL